MVSEFNQRARHARPAPPTGLLEAQKQVLERIVQNRPLGEILGALCEIVEAQAPVEVRAAILLITPDGRHLTTGAAPSLPESYSRAIDGIGISPFVGTCAAAAARRQLVITPDISIDRGWEPFKHLPLGLGLKAAWSLPILSADGGVLGTFGSYFLEPRTPEPDETKLVEVLAHTAALAIERLKSDQALRDSEARYRAMIEASPECVKVVAADGTVLQMNAAGLRMVEAVRDSDIIGQSVFDLIAPEEREAYSQFHARVCGGETASLKFQAIGKSGARRYMESMSVPLPVPGGGYSQLSVTRDITSRVHSDAALAVQKARLEYAVRIAGIGFWYCDLPNGELMWDEQVREHFFIEGDRRVTMDDFYSRLHPEDHAHAIQAARNSIDNAASYDITYRTVSPTGEIKWIHAVGGAEHENGVPTHFDGVTVDVTLQKRDEQRLLKLNERLQEEDHRKDEFLATLAHELRNPLAPLRTGLELLRHSAEPEVTIRTRDMMQRQLMHLVRLVDDLLDISRITSRKITLEKKRVDLREIFHSAFEATDTLMRERGHRLETDLPTHSLTVHADPIRLAQVVANLLNNAARYTPVGGRIFLRSARVNDAAVVQVEDNGAGIEPHMLDSVFEMFVQGQSTRNSQGGLGIGLTLVRRLVEMHGGTVSAASGGRGLGSTFTVTLPLALGAEAQSGADVDTSSKVATGRRVLVVDDNVDAADSLAMLLQVEGHNTRVANDGLEALALAASFRPEVVILDIGMPGMNGHEVARRLRANPEFPPSLKLVALTGWGSLEDRQKAEAAGFDVHLVKPIEPERLRDIVYG